MRIIRFAKRNFLEIVRDPISLAFCLGFPLVLFFVFQLIVQNIPADQVAQAVPQFAIDRLAPSLAVFGFSFLTLFSGMLVAKDRTSSYLARLRTSPMTSVDFIAGYSVPLLPMALIQTIILYSISLLFGLKLTWSLILSLVSLIPIALLFISLGLLLGSLVNDKTIGGLASLIINFAAIFSGMFMPIETMGNTIQTIAKIFPFYNSLKVTQAVIENDYSNFLQPFIILMIYVVVLTTIAILVFKSKINSDKQ